jgi:hypothetical protein
MYDWYHLLCEWVYVITFVCYECTCMHVLFVCNVSSVGMICAHMTTYVRGYAWVHLRVCMYDWYDLLYVCVYVITFVYDECTCMHVFFVCNVSSVGMGCVYMPTYVRDLYDMSAVCDYLSMYECIVHVPLTLAHPQLCIFLDFMRYMHVELCTRTLHAHTAHIRCTHSTHTHTRARVHTTTRTQVQTPVHMYVRMICICDVCMQNVSLSLCIALLCLNG